MSNKKNFEDEIDESRRELALFRHAIIAELDSEQLPRGELTARMAELCGRTYKLPSGRERGFTMRTLWSWWSAFKRERLRGLLPRSRKRGPRYLSPETMAAAIKARSEVPTRSTATLIDVLEKQGAVAKGKLRRSTLDRHLDAAGASRRRNKTLGSKRYTRLLFERPNQFWIGDYHEAPILYDREHDKFRTVHLSAFIDHYSKLVPHGEWYKNEQLATLEDTIKKAILKRGTFEKAYVDNAKVFRSHDFAFAVDRLGGELVHSKRYVSEGRGAIERFNRTIAEGFEPEALAAKIESLEQLNILFEAWLHERYHLQPHGSTGEPPLDRFAQNGFRPKYPDPVLVSDIFRVRVRRKVHPKTACVEVAARFFQCESFTRGRWVSAYYDPFKLDDVLIYLNGKRVQRALPQKVNDPQVAPERPTAAQLSFDYLGALRAEYDQRIVARARHISLADMQPTADFTLPDFLALCARMFGKDLAPYERDELTRAFNTVGPFSEKTCRLALEHALKLRGRGLHVSVYTHYLKTFQLAAIKANKE